MKEQEIKKETTPKKKYYKPKMKREILEIDNPKIGLDNYHKIVNSERPYSFCSTKAVLCLST